MYFSRVKLRPELIKSSQLNRVLRGNVYGIHRLLYDLFSVEQRSFIFREEIAKAQLGHSQSVRGEPIYYLVSQQKPIEPENSIFHVDVKPYHPKLQVGQKLKFDCRVNPVVTRNGRKHDLLMDTQLNFLKGTVDQIGLKASLPLNPRKSDYKKRLLEQGGEALDKYLSDVLSKDQRYAERLTQIGYLQDRLEWAIKSQIDAALENWFQNQGERRCGFQLIRDNDGMAKLQNSAYQWHAIPEKGKTAGFSSVDLTGDIEITDVDAFIGVLFNGIGRAKAFGCGLLSVAKI
ncbi:type I-E CRISPR-associated protein Cas6/Cse3/CasE [Methylotuvimicrobium sp. KM1]|uniref:type I-E CRISPR-associated protein Cas6/Cse3/CasE n=1 Tax=Methylotuvimicrobium sp. KM1 TaxID=3377707 RepID=UPI00384D6355